MSSSQRNDLPPGITAAEAEAIRAAVADAESRTGGEIVALALAEASGVSNIVMRN